MKIKVLGFRWELAGINFADLRVVLEPEAKRRTLLCRQCLTTGRKGDWDGTLFAFADEGKRWVGVVIKVRDQKRFCQLKEDGAKLTLTAEELAAGSKIAEVNFFLLDPATGCGIYQYYHQSTWVDSLSQLCARVLTSHVQQCYLNLAKQAEAEGWSQKRLRAARAARTARLRHEIVVRKEAFDKIVADMKTVRKSVVRLRDDNVKVGTFGAMASDASRATIEFGYSKETCWDRVKTGIRDFARSGVPWRMRVEGVSADGREEIASLVTNRDTFDEIDFDDATATLQIDLLDPAANLTKSALVKRLLEVAKTDRVALLLNPDGCSTDQP